MEDFISRIIEIDKQARQMSVDYDALKAEADKEIAEKNKKVKEKYDKKTDLSVEEYRKTRQAESDKKLEEKKKYYEDLAAHFGEVCEQSKDEWVKALVERTLNRA